MPFQSSKELYLPDDVTEMAITEQLFPILKGTLSSSDRRLRRADRPLFPILKGTLSSRHRSRTAAANKFFPILKGTLSSDMLSIGHGTALDFPILKGTLSSAQLELAWRAVAVFPILKGTLSSMLGVSSQHLYRVTFQSSKELYLQETFSRWLGQTYLFPILKGTLSSIPLVVQAAREGTFQSSKELYLPDSTNTISSRCPLSNPQRNFIFPQKHSHSNNFHGSPLAFTFDIGIRQNTTTLGSQQLI